MDDLWATTPDNQRLLTTEHGRSTRTRHLSERSIVSELRTWLLQDYAAAYCRSLAETRIFRRCYWVDGLGVDGRSARPTPINDEQAPEETPPKKSSRAKSAAPTNHQMLQPVIELGHKLAAENKPIALYGLVLAAGSSKKKEARGQQQKPGKKQLILPKESGLLHASWLEAAPLVLNELAHAPAIFLLNPLAASAFTYDELAALYQRTLPTELCLLISHKQIEVLLHAAQRSTARAGQLTEMVRSDRWKTLPTEEEKLAQAIAGWLKLFTASMQRYFQLPIQAIPLQACTGPATVEDIPYTLIFATRRQDSLLSMNDAVCHHRQHLTAQSWQGVLGEEWFAEQEQERSASALQDLGQRILQQGRAQRTRRWPDLRQQFLVANFGQFTRHDYDMLIQQLLLSREIHCEWRQRIVEPVGIPGSEDTLLWR